MESAYIHKFNTLHAHDTFMRHGYKSRIFVHVSTGSMPLVSFQPANASRCDPEVGGSGGSHPIFSSF